MLYSRIVVGSAFCAVLALLVLALAAYLNRSTPAPATVTSRPYPAYGTLQNSSPLTTTTPLSTFTPTSIPAATGSATSTPTATCTPAWQNITLPDPGVRTSTLNGVAALSASDVWAVGFSVGQDFHSPSLIEHWDGSNWSIVPSPNPSSQGNRLRAITAISPNDIWAVGDYFSAIGSPQTLTMHWNGSDWQQVSSPSPGTYTNFLNGVAAISTTDVWAVGSYQMTTGGQIDQTLTLHWNGTEWSVVPSPNAGNTANRLYAVAAISPDNAWAVGEGDIPGAFILHWDGTQWTIVPAVPQIEDSRLNGITAVSANDIWAVGGRISALALHWDGVAWSRFSTPNPGNQNSAFYAVNALSATDAWAVGSYTDFSGYPQPLVERWNGTSWSSVPAPYYGITNPPPAFYGVAALSATDVWSVGQARFLIAAHYSNACIPTLTPTPTNTVTQTPTPTYTRTITRSPITTPLVTNTPTATPACIPGWGLVTSRNVAGQANFLYGVTAISPSDVWAVGAYGNVPQRTLVEHWDGTQWSIVSSPNPAAGDNILLAVSAVSAGDVWAVGASEAGDYRTLIEHWDGSAWSVVPSPNVGSAGNLLFGITVISANDVWAVGRYGGAYRTLTLHWDGSAWNVVDSPNPTDRDNTLSAVGGVAANDVWAVGTYSEGGPGHIFILHWDGAGWTQAPVPDIGAGGRLAGVRAISPGDVWAVGGRIGGPSPTLTLHWNGSTWHVVPSPGIAFDDSLEAVDALSANDVWAVGTYSSGGNAQTLAMHWDGSAWTIAPTPNGSNGTRLHAVSAISSENVWAAGEVSNQTFTIRYRGLCGTPSSTPTGSPVAATATRTATATLTATPTHTPTRALTPTPTPSATPTATLSSTASATATTTATTTATNSPTRLATSTSTITPCPMNFTDVQPTDYFYEAVRYLYCRGVISGYGDGTFRPYNLTTRGQLAKIVVLAAGWSIYTPSAPTFRDVPATHPFYQYVETAYNHGIISGYGCGPNCLEFRPGNNVTRGQLCKVVVLARAWAIYQPPTPTFRDVPPGDPFYPYIETAYSHAIISGYSCGPDCLEFRTGNNATRGQIAKIVHLAVTHP